MIIGNNFFSEQEFNAICWVRVRLPILHVDPPRLRKMGTDSQSVQSDREPIDLTDQRFHYFYYVWN